ncbi:MAG TPA: hypothetical protein VGR78_09295 [Verrucomicrobiae bacterium]|jgi:hypothetical protein|nr:hypothetical protein [Verrucomicrobiae bacterium]
MRKLCFSLGLIAFLTGCATNRIDWNTRVGHYTYDQAIRELGVPDRSATLSDGTAVGEWLQRRGGAYGTTSGFGYHHFGSYDIYQFPDSYLRLVFGPDGQLQKVERFAR